MHNSDRALKFTTKIRDLITKYEAYTAEAATHSKEINQKSLELSNTINTLSKSFKQIGSLNKKVGIPSQAKLFQSLSKIYEAQAQQLQNTGELIKIYCAQAMKYYN